MNERTSIVSFLAGGVTGAALALLLAPRSGEATRGRIGRKLRDSADSARDLTDRLVERGEEIGDEAARRVHEAGSVLAGHRPRKTRGNGDEVAAT
jgi:gas vesicle protein